MEENTTLKPALVFGALSNKKEAKAGIIIKKETTQKTVGG